MTLSILIPTYNREDFIKQAIDSVLNQEFQDFEIICSDNCSTDSTFDILLKYASLDARIKVFQNEVNLGPVPNWENCLNRSSGEYIHWLWSDDWIEPNFYVDAFDLMKKDGTKCLTTWNYRRDPGKDKYVSWQFSFPLIEGKVAAKKILMGASELPVSPAAYILPRDLVVKHFYLDIPKIGNLDPVKKGVGVDSLMVAASCFDSEQLSVLQKPSVNFRHHNNLSVILAKDGSLDKMYCISHLWFLKKNFVPLNAMEILKLIYRTLKVFKFHIFNFQLFNLLFMSKSIFKSLISIDLLFNKDNYKSNRAVFK